jgi:hypothetical protein
VSKSHRSEVMYQEGLGEVMLRYVFGRKYPIGSMTRGYSVKKVLAAGVMALALAAGAAPAAHANSDSRTVYFNSTSTLTGNVWIQNFAEGGCGSYATSVVSNRVLRTVTNKTTADPWAIGASAWGLSVSGPSGSTSTTWTNYNRSGSYLSGNVCMSWNAIYLSLKVNGTGNYNGAVRTVAAQV